MKIEYQPNLLFLATGRFCLASLGSFAKVSLMTGFRQLQTVPAGSSLYEYSQKSRREQEEGGPCKIHPATLSSTLASSRNTPVETAITLLVWLVALVCIVGGALGTIVPALPGTPLIFCGIFLVAWWGDFSVIGALPLIVCGVLAVVTLGIDLLATVLGARRVGASRLAVIGAMVGTIIGMFFLLPGLIIGQFIGALLGEYVTQRDLRQATKVGFSTWVALLVGTAAKVALAATMIGVFVGAALIG
jgi:uncharacterized protein YqgC (DUF456 family)